MVKNAVIERLGMKADTAGMVARALKTLAGARNVRIVLRGEWRTLQGNTLLKTPCPANIFSNGDIEAVHNSTMVRPEAGGTVDIEARVERTVRHAG